MRYIFYGQINEAAKAVLADRQAVNILNDIADGNNNLHDDYSKETLNLLSHHKIIKKLDSRYEFGPSVVYVPEMLEDQLLSLARKSSKTYSSYISARVSSIKENITHSFPELMTRFGWNSLSHLVIGGFILDMAVGKKLYERYQYGGQSWIICYQRQANQLSEVGVRITSIPEGNALLGLFWNSSNKSAQIYFTVEDAQLILDVIHGAITPGKKEQLQLLKMAYFKVLKRAEHGYEANLPVFPTSLCRELEDRVSDIAGEIVNRIILPDLKKAKVFFDRYGSKNNDCPGRLVYNRLLMEATYLELSRAGVVGKPAEIEKNCWGAWMWIKDSEKFYPFLSEEHWQNE